MSDQAKCLKCECTENLIPVVSQGARTDDVICVPCVRREDEFSFCKLCAEEFAYYTEELTEDGECQDHKGELTLSPEDQEGWEHNARKWSEE